MPRTSKVTDEDLAAAVAKSFTMTEVISTLGLRHAGGTHSHYRKRVSRLGLDTSHWLRRHPGCKGVTQKSAESILVSRPGEPYRTKTYQLRRAMIESGVEYICECGQGPEWNGKPLTLQVEHKNGDSTDDRLENLCFLCPNCHTQTSTYGRVKKDK